MPDKPLDIERLKELVGQPQASADGDEFVHQIAAPRRKPESVDQLAAAAVAAIEASRGPRRQYSSDAPPVMVIDRKRGSYVFLAIAIGVAIWVGLRLVHRTPPVPSDPVELVAALSPRTVATPGLAPDWDAVRGASESLGERARAVRIGALLVEFERASVRDDSTAQPAAEGIAALLVNEVDGAEVAGIFAGGGREARSPEARHKLAPLVRAAPMGVGAWLQASRVAAAAGDIGFFAGVRSRESLALLLAMPGITPDVEAARDRLDTLLHRRGRPDFAAVADALALIQRELAN